MLISTAKETSGQFQLSSRMRFSNGCRPCNVTSFGNTQAGLIAFGKTCRSAKP